MHRITPRILLYIVSALFALQLSAQEAFFASPLNIPIRLSANFGELRANHFHAGLDFKTQQVIGHPVFAADSAYVSRIRVSGVGYGTAIYLTHPSGYTTVYGHLSKLSPFLDSIVTARQYRDKSFVQDFTLPKDSVCVARSQQIALSGNSGSSGGPHLHFEVRNAQEEAIDPQEFYQIPDNVRPRIKSFAIDPVLREGVVEENPVRKAYDVKLLGNGKYALRSADTIRVWGRIGLLLKAYDYMTGTSNFYGVRRMSLYVDSNEVSHYENKKHLIEQSRYINAFIDYATYKTSRDMYMRSFLLPNNRLKNLTQMSDNGYLQIDEERDYQVRMVVEDAHGLTAELNMVLRGEESSIPLVLEDSSKYKFAYDLDNRIDEADLEFSIPRGSFYENINFQYKELDDSTAQYSGKYQLHYATIPLQKSCALRIRLQNDSLADKSKYYIGLENKHGSYNFVGNNYQDGFLTTYTRGLGNYKILCDTIAPSIRLLRAGQELHFTVKDGAAGLQDLDGYIDGEWALFTFDNKRRRLKYVFDPAHVQRNKKHKVEVKVTDRCGNLGTYTTEVWW